MFPVKKADKIGDKGRQKGDQVDTMTKKKGDTMTHKRGDKTGDKRRETKGNGRKIRPIQ